MTGRRTRYEGRLNAVQTDLIDGAVAAVATRPDRSVNRAYTSRRAAWAALRRQVVEAYIDWHDRRVAERVRFNQQPYQRGGERAPYWPTLAAFHRGLAGQEIAIGYRTLWEWLRRYLEAGPAGLVDHRGRPRGRTQVDSELWGRLLALVAAGESVSRAHRTLAATARARRLAWPALRRVQERVAGYRRMVEETPYLLEPQLN